MAAAAITLRCGTGRAPRAFRLCVLDCDGIIFNSNRLKTDAYRATLREIGVAPVHVEAFVDLHLSDVSVSRFVKFQKFFAEVLPAAERPALHEDGGSGGNTTVDRLVQRALDGYSRNCLTLYEGLVPVPESVRFAKACTRKPFVCSGGAQTELAHVFAHHDIRDHFDEVLGSPTTKIEHMQRVMRETQVAPEDILFIGDGWTDFKTSMAVGAHFCFLTEMSDWANADQQIAEGLAASPQQSITQCSTWEGLLDRIVGEDV
jgi:phosphoglycolate phosphatase-like HAD superfamily hydrolase